jgi:hypothetical protein
MNLGHRFRRMRCHKPSKTGKITALALLVLTFPRN